MKKLIIGSLILIMVSGTSFAQFRGALTDPKAKNYKPWQNTQKSQGVEELVTKKVSGPKAKNKKYAQIKIENAIFADASSLPKQKLTGPKAKNYKPWMV